VIIRVAR